MAKKNKRSQQKKPQRSGRSASRGLTRPPSLSPTVPLTDASFPSDPTTVPNPAPTPAAVPRSSPVARPVPRSARGRATPGPLPAQDASIPLDRVPYFRADLRRIAITAGAMFVILIVGSIVLRNLLLA
jgi:hypothetical protein